MTDMTTPEREDIPQGPPQPPGQTDRGPLPRSRAAPKRRRAEAPAPPAATPSACATCAPSTADSEAVHGIDLDFPANQVTAMIGPSGCGKSTVVRCINRMHEEIPGARATGSVTLDDLDIYGPGVDVIAVRQVIGMVFQKPNPFPTMSIYDNVAAGLKLSGRKRGHDLDEVVERSLRGAGLWEEVKDRLGSPGIGLSGGQQQRLCIARTMAVEPEVILMDEPCSALDPIATLKIEELIEELKLKYTIVIVTHNMQQAGRVADRTAFMLNGRHGRGRRDREDLHEPERLPDRGVRHREVRMTAAGEGRPTFQQQLATLEDQALGGLDIVVEQLDRVLEAVKHTDVELAEIVIADDDRVDGRYLEVHQGILSALALQAPVAGDLRVVAALLHVMKNIERMGDQCVNIAKLIPLSGHEPPIREEIMQRILDMGHSARAEVLQAKRAFADRDVEMAEDLVRADRATNRINRELFRIAVEVGDDPDTREWAMLMTLVGRAIERIGDNAVDIGEQTAFVVTGLFREFSDSSHPQGLAPRA